jgi:hypothetical protein
LMNLFERSESTFGASAIGSLICFMVSSSLIVIDSFSRVSKSTVNAYGIPHSSVLAYLFPTETPESSILAERPALVRSDFISWTLAKSGP